MYIFSIIEEFDLKKYGKYVFNVLLSMLFFVIICRVSHYFSS